MPEASTSFRLSHLEQNHVLHFEGQFSFDKIEIEILNFLITHFQEAIPGTTLNYSLRILWIQGQQFNTLLFCTTLCTPSTYCLDFD